MIQPQRFELFDKVRFYPGVCSCPGSVKAKEKAELEAKREELKGVATGLIVRAGISEGKLSKYRFGSFRDDQYPGAGAYKQQVLQFVNEVKLGGKNTLFIYGNYGVGKSHLAVAALRQVILNHVIDEIPWRGYFCDWTEHCSLVKETFDRDNQTGPTEGQLWGKMRGSHLVVIDDLDKLEASKWALGKLFEVIQHRYYSEKPTIITANHSPEELQRLWGKSKTEHVRDAGRAIISRFMEHLWRVIHIDAKDQRGSL